MQCLGSLSVIQVKNQKKTMMKKVLMIALLCALFAGISPAEAQVRFGVKGGMNLTSLSFEKDDYTISNKVGFHIGPTLMYSLPIKGLGLDAAVMYDQRSGSVEADISGGRNYATTIKRQQIIVPLNVRYDIGIGEGFGAFVFAGPQVGINLSNKTTETNYGDWEPKSMDFCMNMGVGVMIARHLQLSANYNLVCGKDADISINRQWGESYAKIVNNGKMNAWQISLAYYF